MSAILAVVFVVLTLDLRTRVHTEVADNLEAGRRVVTEIERRRPAELDVYLGALRRNPTLVSTVDRIRNQFGGFSPLDIRQATAWLERELQQVAEGLGVDVAAVVDNRGLTLARAGAASAEWPGHVALALTMRGTSAADTLVRAEGGYFRVTSVPLDAGPDRFGTVLVGVRLDQRRAANISMLTRAETAIVVRGSVIASTLSPGAGRLLASIWTDPIPERGEVSIGPETYAFRRLDGTGDTAVYGLAPLSVPASTTTARAFRALGFVAAGALVLAILGSVLLARRLTDPIDEISQSLSSAARSRNLDLRLKVNGSSRELDALTETFNDLMASLSRAEEETRVAYLGAIQALVIALEARDRYTAGHSQRVADLSVRIGQRMALPDREIDELRLGALLHDIGKIGIGDAVLTKPGPLNDAERRAIQAHSTVGARILQPVAFLAPQLPIVELHHEQPDGRGFPHGLKGDAIPVAVSIVRLADAYDAITSDRPYRSTRTPREAVEEINRHRGSGFDAAVVDAFLAVMREADPTLALIREADPALVGATRS